jgi:mycothiol synthase
MELQPLTKKDLPDLMKLAKLSSPGINYLSAKAWDFQLFQDPDQDPSFLLKAVEKKALLGVAAGVARKNGAQKIGYLKYFGVAPKARRRGVARELFGEMERRFQKRDCQDVRVGACPPPFIQGGVDALDTATHCFLLGRGYQRTEAITDMTGDLKGWKAVYSDADKKLMKEYGVRKAGAKDEAALLAFVQRDFPHWQWEARRSLDVGEVFVAGLGGELSAFACSNGTQQGWFGPTGTAESLRGKGLGRLLMWKCLETLKKQGVKAARIPWVGPIPFYTRYANAGLGPLFWTFAKRV